MPKWLPIETSPRDVVVLLSFDDHVIVGKYDTNCHGGQWLGDGEWMLPASPTHWMPFPRPFSCTKHRVKFYASAYMFDGNTEATIDTRVSLTRQGATNMTAEKRVAILEFEREFYEGEGL